ncbi:MAG: endonuclease Q family protein [Candidatus Bathyarchaeia archaeon]
MAIPEITKFAEAKGLNLVGTGDFTNPRWLAEIKENLEEVPDADIYRPRVDLKSPVRFMITGEVSTIFTYENRVRKVHHVIWTPNIETGEQINDRLAGFGDLSSDGRPVFNASAPEIAEVIMETSARNVIIPAHVWTPWFSLFGAFSGFDRIEDCYQDQTEHIFALETGLSSDPPMNWRLSELDRFALVSNSDCHSAWPWRLGREANLLELERLSYEEIVDAIRSKDAARFKGTIEVNPAYGKYHWTGHRGCGISMPPQKAMSLQDFCPVCHLKLTKGVEERIEELADRPPGFKPEGAISFTHLLPLHEIIANAVKVSSFTNKTVWRIYNTLIGRFGNEYSVLMEASAKKMGDVVGPRVAEAILRVREGLVKIEPGYDGEYGKLEIFEEGTETARESRLTLEDFW